MQIRADERAVTEKEEKDITKIARERTIAAYGKDNKAFILDIMEDKFGFDIYFGSEHLCKRIAEALELDEKNLRRQAVSERESMDILSLLPSPGKKNSTKWKEDEERLVDEYRKLDDKWKEIVKNLVRQARKDAGSATDNT